MFPFWNDIEQSKRNERLYPYLLSKSYPLAFVKSPKAIHINHIDFQSDRLSSLFHEEKGTSPFPSAKGSITVECSIVLPMFLVFCMQLICVISLMQLHSNIEAALHQSVSKWAIREYLANSAGIETDSAAGLLASDVVIRSDIVSYIGKENLDDSMIVGGSNGIVVYKDPRKRNGQDVLDISVSYYVKPLIGWFGFPGMLMGNHCRVKPWTGYIPCGFGEYAETYEPNVYITERGTVYHMDYDCTHLQLSIEPVQKSTVGSHRNEDGGKYYPCEYCGKMIGTIVYITTQGDRYHASLNCKGLKRSIYKVPLSEVGGRGPCSRCAA